MVYRDYTMEHRDHTMVYRDNAMEHCDHTMVHRDHIYHADRDIPGEYLFDFRNANVSINNQADLITVTRVIYMCYMVGVAHACIS